MVRPIGPTATQTAMGRAALLPHVVIVDGQVVGGWKRAQSKTTVVVELSLVAGLRTTERKAVVAAAQSFGRFLELSVELRGVGGRG